MRRFLHRVAQRPEAGLVVEELDVSSITSSTSEYTLTWDNALSYYLVSLALSNFAPVSDNQGAELRTSSNGGSSYDSGASDYQYRVANFAASYTTLASGGATEIVLTGQGTCGLSNVAGEEAGGEINIIRPSLSNGIVHVHSTLDFVSAGGTLATVMASGARLADADVDGIRIAMETGNIASLEVVAFGVRPSCRSPQATRGRA